jgi:hypothetical protein
MPKILIPHVIEPQSAGAMIYPADPRSGQLCFYVGEHDVYHVVLSRVDMQKLAREIEKQLKAVSLPSDGQ